MAKNKNSDLRDHLFEVIEGLKDGTVSIEVAAAVCGVSQTIINSAKIDVEMAKVLSASVQSGGFFGVVEENRELPKMGAPGERKLLNGAAQ